MNTNPALEIYLCDSCREDWIETADSDTLIQEPLVDIQTRGNCAHCHTITLVSRLEAIFKE